MTNTKVALITGVTGQDGAFLADYFLERATSSTASSDRPSSGLGGPVSRSEPERRQAQFVAASKGTPWLKTLLVQCAWAATRKKDCYYKAQFNRFRGKHGPKKAICAVAASMLTAIYHILKDGVPNEISASTISTSGSPKRRSSASSLRSLNSASKQP